MIELPFTEDMLVESKRLADSLGSLRNSIEGGRGNRAGYLGEIALRDFFGAEMVSCRPGEDKFSHDLLLHGRRVEVKTKRRVVKPLASYEVSVARTSKHQRPDDYAFVSLHFERHFGKPRIYRGLIAIWLCGTISAEQFWKDARTVEKGDVNPSNGFKAHATMFNLPISQLKVPTP